MICNYKSDLQKKPISSEIGKHAAQCYAHALSIVFDEYKVFRFPRTNVYSLLRDELAGAEI